MNNDSPRQEVRVTDIRMPFGSMVLFMVKWAIASIPALIILVVVGAALWGTAAALLVSLITPSRRAPAGGALPGASSTGPARSGSSSGSSEVSPEQAAYLSKILVRNVSVGKSVLGETGVFGEVKNTGDRTLTKLEITIYCLGSNGKPVFEKTYNPVLVTDLAFGADNQPLKPGYSRQFGVKMDDAPSDWTKEVDVKVTEVGFQ